MQATITRRAPDIVELDAELAFGKMAIYADVSAEIHDRLYIGDISVRIREVHTDHTSYHTLPDGMRRKLERELADYVSNDWDHWRPRILETLWGF